MSEPVAAVLFDVDGTLVDTNYLHAVTWWQAFGQAGYHLLMAAVPCIGLLSGGIGREELIGAGAVQIYDGPQDLLVSFPASLLGTSARRP
jgi:hypothetical protein